MLFNSLEYIIFLSIVFFAYWILNARLRAQNILLISFSYLFYGWWDYRFLFLLVFSTVLDYVAGIVIHGSDSKVKKKFWLVFSISINLGFLGFFKYYNFFIESFTDLIQSFGLQANVWTLKVILPVGISFYTFHGLSYVLDIYFGRIRPTRNFVDYGLFVSYFPLLVAGPIERATHLLPQIEKSRKFNYAMAVEGLKQILWGLFKKVVIADNCAELANMYFNNYQEYAGMELFLGALFFAFQIYGDFSGYSDIALGTSKLFGITLLRNFNYPYFSRDIAEFWRRWHISLSGWFRDYLYIPLGGSKGSRSKTVRNIFIIFLVSGFWHGANWTFVFWGGLNAIYFLPLLLMGKNRQNTDTIAQDTLFPDRREFFGMAITFFLVCIAWIFFRSDSVTDAFMYIKYTFSDPFHVPEITKKMTLVFLLLTFFIVIEWLGRKEEFAISKFLEKKYWAIRWGFYFILIEMVMILGGKQQEFIYFQF